jgi:hypothetical protein
VPSGVHTALHTFAHLRLLSFVNIIAGSSGLRFASSTESLRSLTRTERLFRS